MIRKKELLRDERKNLYMIYDTQETFCYYVVSVGKPEIKRGDLMKKNILFHTKDLNECLRYWNARGNR